MKPWQRAALIACGAGGAGVLCTRYLWFRRLPLPTGYDRSYLARGGLDLHVAHYRADHDRLVIVVHGLLKSMASPSIVGTLAGLRPHIDVTALDLPGHGASAGECDLDVTACAQAVEGLVDEAREQGYRRIALLGCSLGAAVVILAAARGARVDAVVAVSAPAAPLPRTVSAAAYGARTVQPTGLLRPWARLMGTRLAPVLHPGPWPIESVAEVSPVPLLIVHNGWDTLVRRGDSDALFAVARPPKRILYAPRALHADPVPSLSQVVEWLTEVMP